MSHTSPALHNAMWPGLVGKGDEAGQEPPISLERMLDLTAAAEVDGQKFEGIDYFLFLPHTNPEASDDELKAIADLIAGKGFDIKYSAVIHRDDAQLGSFLGTEDLPRNNIGVVFHG